MNTEINKKMNLEDLLVNTLENWTGTMPDEKQLAMTIGGNLTFKEIKKALKNLQKEGRVMKTQRGKWAIPEKIGYLIGNIQRNQKGFGFLIPLNKEHEDVFIPPSNLKGVMSGDLVIAKLIAKNTPKGRKTEGEIYKVLKRSTDNIVGTLETIPSGGFVVPDKTNITSDIYIPRENLNGAQDKEKVVVQIVEFPEKKRSPVGKIIEVIGSALDVGVDILSIVKAMEIEDEFSEKVIRKAKALSQVPVEDSIKGRLDLRSLKTFTIDGSDSKDFDDAVSIQKIGLNKWRLGVHIADVSHYVVDGSNIDKTARRRATSIYLVDRVIPMLPESLSNEICSLNPNVDRLTMSCIMDVDANGRVIDYSIKETVIRSHARFTYDDVNAIFEGDEELKTKYKDFIKELNQMNKLAKILNGKRIQRGSLELDIDEPHIRLDDMGVPVSVSARKRGDSQKLIEEFMLCANETVAKHLMDKNLPGLFRVHEDPDELKMKEFLEFAGNIGYRVSADPRKVTPKDLQMLLDNVSGNREEDVIHRILLRTLQKARYSPINMGHFGLASEFYCHFTSPIRRYPDLIVHRALRASMKNNKAQLEAMHIQVEDIATHCSEMERTAMEAERKVDDLKMTEYMSYHIGEEYEGIISGVKEYGFYVELTNTIEGLVHVSKLTDDFYVYYDKQYMLMGERIRKQYRLGDAVNVRCIRADIVESNIDFELVEPKDKD